jgi:hypothetical protein
VSVPTGVTLHFTMEPLPLEQAQAAMAELRAAYAELEQTVAEEEPTGSGRR